MPTIEELTRQLAAETARADANARDAERSRGVADRLRALVEHRLLWALDNLEGRERSEQPTEKCDAIENERLG